jgi:AraC family transcriptional regulator, ethanolamine operon transcriptional activator
VNLDSSARAFRYTVSTHDSHDTWTHEHLAIDWQQKFQQLRTDPFHARLDQAWLGPLHLGREAISVPFRFEGSASPGTRVFFVPLPGTDGLRYHGRLLQPGMLVLGRWDTLDGLTCSRSARGLMVNVHESFLQQHSERVLGRPLSQGDIREDRCSVDPQVVRLFGDTVSSVLDELTRSDLILTNPSSRLALQDTVLLALMNVLESLNGETTRLPPPSTRAYIVNKALEYVDSRAAESITVADLCESIGISSRTLRYSFEAVLGVSPMRYVLARRLDLVRRELLSAEGDVMIEAVAVRNGFWHLGRFASYYRETFGERPSETRSRALHERSVRRTRASLPASMPHR